MIKKQYKIIAILLLALLLLSTFSYAQDEKKDNKNDEKRFQLGFGLLVSSSNLLSLIESGQIYQATKDDRDYSFPGISDKEEEALSNLDGAMKRSILVANILGAMEYGAQVRVLWNILMIEADLLLVPFDASYNGRIDLMFTPMIGVRAPFFIMPYALAGIAFTFSFYPEVFTQKEIWRGNWVATDNFVFRPGMNIRLGLDLKLKGFSIGGYYQYTVKDFQEFGSWYWHIMNAGYSAAEAAGKILAAQSRFGVSICLYLF